MTLQELIDKSILQARRVVPAIPVSQLEAVANTLLPDVLQDITKRCMADPRKRPLLKKAKTVSFTDGAATLSSDVLIQTRDDSTLVNTSDTTSLYSHVPEWQDFVNVYDTRLGYYSVKLDRSIYVVEPGAVYVEGDGLTGDRQLLIHCAVAVPSSGASAVDADEEVTADLVAMLAERLVGEVQEVAA